MNDEWVEEISNRYIELYEKVTGKTFVKANYENILADIENSIKNELKKL
jgi:phosphoribosylaminoimidazole-succinocarboxamide synthase